MSRRLTLTGLAGMALFSLATVLSLSSCSDGDTITNVTSISIYGDGSAGARVISADETYADENPQYTDFTVEAGATLTVTSGTVIQCTGTFTNAGTIVVLTGALGSRQTAFAGGIDGSFAPAEAGVSKRSAAPGEYGDNTATRAGGNGGTGLSASEARSIVRPGVKAGGGAGGAYARPGSGGGGSLVIRARGAVVNSGTIHADGETATIRSGGGGGGIVILASDGAITNTGTISAKGGEGGSNDSFAGGGGGGGGGIIHLMSTNITPGSTDVSAGAPGPTSGTVFVSPHQGGGGGGACGGSGGNGGTVNATGIPTAGGAGQDGHVLTTSANPGALFLNSGSVQ